ncbi:hypothetical protein SDC9_111241 [bioreactor metagenome]|uniref:Uncharacterized protein n=1 Tax=bioreactor metagenome TaxID=1076179 RepID=A0A645BFZ2_9ZZZZ
MGVNVIATHREKIVAKTIVRAKSCKNCPAIPFIKATGINTPKFVAVVEKTERAISAVPFSDATNASSPKSLNL